jgi:ABC-type lipoprotein release transport system permease subunit
MAGAWLRIAATGVEAARLHPLRSAVTVGCLVAVLLPYVAGAGLLRGLRDQAEASIRSGADLYVTGERLGRGVPLPTRAAEAVAAIPGVTSVVPRIVGEVRLGAAGVSAVLVGMPADALPASTEVVDGRLFSSGVEGELVVGSQLARRLGLRPGSKVPPFYANEAGERVSTVVGVFSSDLPVWEANLVLCSFESAERVFAQRGLASSLLVWCRPGYATSVGAAVRRRGSLGAPEDDREHGPIRPLVTTREDLEAMLPRGLLHREGVFHLHFVLLFAVGIPLVLLTTGVGLAERRRETGLLKATGWQTDEVLLRALAESLLLAAGGASLAVLLAALWLGPLGGFGIAGTFLSGVDAVPGVRVPFRLTPVPALLAFSLSLAVVLTGTIGSSWRAASAPPAEALR